jgi:serine/threonine-protein kinase HipA
MLEVYFEDYRVGTVTPGTDGPAFNYARHWEQLRGAFPVSLTMPLGESAVEPGLFGRWAANLLPEAAQLAAIGRHLGVAPGDVVGLLAQIGRDTAGALSFGGPGTTSPAEWRPIESDSDFERIIDELPMKPFLAGEEGVSMSLAGVHSKIAVALDSSGALFIPLNGAPSTHILKPDSDRLWGSVENEAYCLCLARLCGLAVPDFSIGRAGRRSYLLVERYDRRRVGERWRRLHQEDFCQALAKPPAAKYERSSSGVPGITLTDMLQLAKAHLGARDVLALLDLAIFNILACNTDAHAKNYSVLIHPAGASLAPAYDIMCAEPYDGITRNLAQTIAGKNRGDHLKRRHWRRLFKGAGLGVRASLERVSSLAERVQRQAAAAREAIAALPGAAPEMPERCAASVDARARAILAGLADDSGSDEDLAAG